MSESIRSCRERRAPFIDFVAAAARQRLCGRARADDGVPLGDRPAGAARPRGRPPRGTRDAGPAARAARGLSTALFDIHFLGAEAIDLDGRRRRGRGPRPGGSARQGRTALRRRSRTNSGEAATRAEALVERRFGPGRRGRSAAAAQPRGRRRACRSGCAIGACAPGAAPLVDLAPDVARQPRATTAKSCKLARSASGGCGREGCCCSSTSPAR